MTAQGATSGSPFFDDYRVEASTGNAASPSTVFLQLGNWISAPLFPHFWQRAFLRKTSVDASGPKRMTALQEPDGVSLLQEVRQFGDVRGDPPRFIACQPVREAATNGLIFEVDISQRPAVCIFDNEAFAVLNNTPGRGKPTGFDVGGSARTAWFVIQEVGDIPTCVGNTLTQHSRTACMAGHPHTRGEHSVGRRL